MINRVLTKSKKRIARQIIEKGLQKEFENGIRKLDHIISKWKSNSLTPRDAWMELYDALNSHDKHITKRYDDMTGSKYLLVLVGQLADRDH
ncbi:MAG: hypothetical protein ACNA7V_14750 [Bacteroidales bacterium]